MFNIYLGCAADNLALCTLCPRDAGTVISLPKQRSCFTQQQQKTAKNLPDDNLSIRCFPFFVFSFVFSILSRGLLLGDNGQTDGRSDGRRTDGREIFSDDKARKLCSSKGNPSSHLTKHGFASTTRFSKIATRTGGNV